MNSFGVDILRSGLGLAVTTVAGAVGGSGTLHTCGTTVEDF
jgi:hypothetical protein